MTEIPPMSTEQTMRNAGRHEEANALMYADLSPLWFKRMRHFRIWGKAREL